MNENKPIRRHSQLRYASKIVGYSSKILLRVPIGMAFILLASICVVATLASGVMTFSFLTRLLTGSSFNRGHDLMHGTTWFGAFLCALRFNKFAYRLYRAYETLPEGHLLNPLPPAVNEVLPEAEVLVRASSVTDAAQRETLLRPAAATDETAPQTLLRAANSQTGD